MHLPQRRDAAPLEVERVERTRQHDPLAVTEVDHGEAAAAALTG